jgi:hypothetical protein
MVSMKCYDAGGALLISPLTVHVLGFGTVDSGHLCLSGYNEVILLRRLPKGHDRNAMLNALGGDVFRTPHHNDEKVRIPQLSPLSDFEVHMSLTLCASSQEGMKLCKWPGNDEIMRMKSLK